VIYAPPPSGSNAGFSRAGTRWVLKWDGTARRVSIAGAAAPKRQGNRIEWIWASDKNNMWVTFSDMAPNDPPRNIRLCEARHETRLDGGETFNPEWLAKVREGAGIVRFMDWQATNFNRSTLRVDDIPGPRYFSIGGETKTPFVRGGVPLALMSMLASEVQAHAWVCIPTMLGTHKLSSIATIDSGATATVHAPGHTWEDADRVILYGTDWPQIERGIFTVTKSSPARGTFQLAGIDSSKFPPYATKWATATSPIDLVGMTREVGKLAAHFRDTMPAGLITYFELGNEVWNWIFAAPHWLLAQARHKFASDDNNRLAGYLAAHCMRTIRDTYGPARRKNWSGVLATQTANPDVTNRMLAGAQHYIAEQALPYKIADLFDNLAVTGYWGGPFSKDSKPQVLRWMDESERRWLSGAEPSQFSYFSRLVNEDCRDARHSGNRFAIEKLESYWRAHKKFADTHGLGFIQYEGGNHSTLGQLYGSLTEAERARFMNFYRACNHTIEDASNYTAMFERFTALGGTYPSKFVEAAPVSRYGAWGGLRHLNDNNPVWDAVVAFNKRPTP